MADAFNARLLFVNTTILFLCIAAIRLCYTPISALSVVLWMLHVYFSGVLIPRHVGDATKGHCVRRATSFWGVCSICSTTFMAVNAINETRAQIYALADCQSPPCAASGLVHGGSSAPTETHDDAITATNIILFLISHLATMVVIAIIPAPGESGSVPEHQYTIIAFFEAWAMAGLQISCAASACRSPGTAPQQRFMTAIIVTTFFLNAVATCDTGCFASTRGAATPLIDTTEMQPTAAAHLQA